MSKLSSGGKKEYEILIATIANKILENSKDPDYHNLIKHFSFCAILSTEALIKTVMFPGDEDYNNGCDLFYRDIDKFDSNKITTMFKLYVINYLIVFLNDKRTVNAIVEMGISKQMFVDAIYATLELDSNDKDFFYNMNKMYQGGNLGKYALTFYSYFTASVLGESDKDSTNAIYYNDLMCSAFDNFISVFDELLPSLKDN